MGEFLVQTGHFTEWGFRPTRPANGQILVSRQRSRWRGGRCAWDNPPRMRWYLPLFSAALEVPAFMFGPEKMPIQIP